MSLRNFIKDKLNEEGMTGYNITGRAPLYAVLGAKIFPNGFTADATTLSQKEIFDAVIVVKNALPEDLAQYVNSIQDAISVARKNEENNKVADLEIRLFIVRTALALADVWNKYGNK